MENNRITPHHHPEYKERLDDHEKRIRKVEDTSNALRYELSNVAKNQADLKAIILDINREQAKNIEGLMERIISFTNNTADANKQLKIIDRKEFWGITALIIGSLLTYFLK